MIFEEKIKALCWILILLSLFPMGIGISLIPFEIYKMERDDCHKTPFFIKWGWISLLLLFLASCLLIFGMLHSFIK